MVLIDPLTVIGTIAPAAAPQATELASTRLLSGHRLSGTCATGRQQANVDTV